MQKRRRLRAYNGEKNIHFVGKGGVSIDMKYMKYGIAFDVAHNDGVTIEKINFKNVNVGHFIEMDASANVSVTGCTFKNVKKNSDYVKEATIWIRLTAETQGFHNDWSTYDKTQTECDNCKLQILESGTCDWNS